MLKKIRNFIKENIEVPVLWAASLSFVVWHALIFVWQEGKYEWIYLFSSMFFALLLGEAMAHRDPKRYGIPVKRRITFGYIGFVIIFGIWFMDFGFFENPDMIIQFMTGN